MRRFAGDTGTLEGLATVLLIAPFLVFRDVPLYDLPNHIASLHLLFGDVAGADGYYAAAWRLVPNLAAEIWVALFHRVISIDLALRLFLATTVAQLFWGTVALNRTLFGGRNRFTLAAALFAYNGPLLFGFINLSFGLGMVLWAVAAWIRWRDERWALPSFALIGCLILLAHLFAFAVYALVICTYELGTLRRGRRRTYRGLLGMLHLALPAALYAVAMPHALAGGGIAYVSPVMKLQQLVGAIGFYNPVFDAVSLVALVLGAAMVGHRFEFAREMTLPIAALVAAYIVLPHQIGSATFVDYRMPPVIALFLCGSLTWRENRRRNSGDAFVLALFGLRWLLIVVQFHAWQADFAEYRTAFAQLPRGATLLPLMHDPNAVDPGAHPPLAHVDALAVIERGALVPDLFAGLGYELLAYRASYRALATQTPTAALAPNFDYVLLIRPEKLLPAEAPHYREIARGRTFILGQIER